VGLLASSQGTAAQDEKVPEIDEKARARSPGFQRWLIDTARETGLLKGSVPF
jgi:hypothetical protein